MWKPRQGFLVQAMVLASLVLARPTPGFAQVDSGGDTTSLRTYCGRDRATLARQPVGDDYVRALSGIQSCDGIAGEVLAQQWRTLPADSATVMLLGAVSANVRDQRIYEAVRDIAMSGGAETVARLAAIATLVAYADSTVRLQYFVPPAGVVSAPPGVGFAHPLSEIRTARPGRPLSGSVRSDVVAMLANLGESDANDRVRSVAAYVAKRMKGGMY